MYYKTIFLILPALVLAQAPVPDSTLQNRGIRVQPLPDKNTRQKLEPPKSSVVVPHGFALIVGIAKYKNLDQNENLHFTENDAQRMQQVLTSSTGGNFKPEDVKTLIGPQATLQALRSALEDWLPKVSKTGDRVLIYFAGHGVTDEHGKGFLAPYDIDVERPEQTAYPMDRLAEVFRNRIQASWKVLLTDACHSGLISRDFGTVTDSLSDSNTIFSFAASRSSERAFEDPELHHGVFTYYLARALEGEADYNGDGSVTADELVDYVRNHVIDHTRSRQKEVQHPRESQDFGSDLVLAFNPSHVAHPDSLPEGGLVVQANMDGVAFLLDGEPKGVVSRNAPLPLPGIKAGPHTIQGVKQGYEPDGPREVMVQPGLDTPVNIRIQFARTRKKAAVQQFEQGRKQYDHAKTLQQCKDAAGLFRKALEIDPAFSEAALYLGRTYRLLDNEPEAIRYHKMAIELDPDYSEARVSYGVMLTDIGNTNEAIQELLKAVERDPRNDQAYSHLAHAYRMADAFDKSAENAQTAIGLNPANAQAHLWLGDCFRQMQKFQDAEREYTTYVQLSDFDPNVYFKSIAYFVLPTFTTRAGSQQLAYKDQRNQGYFGLCVCAEKLNNFNVAIQYCKKALSYDREDPYSIFILGRIYLEKYDLTANRGALEVSRVYFKKVIQINPDLQEAGYAKRYLEEIDRVLKQLDAKASLPVR